VIVPVEWMRRASSAFCSLMSLLTRAVDAPAACSRSFSASRVWSAALFSACAALPVLSLSIPSVFSAKPTIMPVRSALMPYLSVSSRRAPIDWADSPVSPVSFSIWTAKSDALWRPESRNVPRLNSPAPRPRMPSGPVSRPPIAPFAWLSAPPMRPALFSIEEAPVARPLPATAPAGPIPATSALTFVSLPDAWSST